MRRGRTLSCLFRPSDGKPSVRREMKLCMLLICLPLLSHVDFNKGVLVSFTEKEIMFCFIESKTALLDVSNNLVLSFI